MNGGEKRFARGISRAMIRSYKLYKQSDSSFSEFELVKKTLSDRPGRAAEILQVNIEGSNYWENIVKSSFVEIIFTLVYIEYLENMHGTMDTVNESTQAVFRNTISEEIKNANLYGA